MHQRIHQRAGIVPGSGMHHHSRGLVDYDGALVLIEHGQRDVLRCRPKRGQRNWPHLNLLRATDQIGRFLRFSTHMYLASLANPGSGFATGCIPEASRAGTSQGA